MCLIGFGLAFDLVDNYLSLSTYPQSYPQVIHNGGWAVVAYNLIRQT